MAELNKNWLTEKHIDFEYKKYVLLAYLQEVKQHFDSTSLYPWLAELIDHYKGTIAVKENREQLKQFFPKRLKGIGKNGELTYESLIDDSEMMEELEAIIEFAIPRFHSQVEEGRSVYDVVEEHMYLQPVGLIPLDQAYGYLFLKGGQKNNTYVYEYREALFESSNEKFKALHTRFVKSFTSNLSTTYQSIKSDLLRENKELANPATYAVESDLDIPLEDTFLPVAKRMLMQHLMSAGRISE